LTELDDEDEGLIYSSVLHLRGENPIEQPLINENGILCYNGEIWTEDY